MKCEYCEIVGEERRDNRIYEDEQVIAFVRDMAALPGQVTVIPKEHFTILELVPDDILAAVAKAAQKVSVAVFEGFNSKGTNIIVQNGIAGGQKMSHFALEVIPRQEGDGLNLQWQPKQLMEDEMEMAFSTLGGAAAKLIDVGKGKHVKKEPAPGGASPAPLEEKENYLLKSLRRRP